MLAVIEAGAALRADANTLRLAAQPEKFGARIRWVARTLSTVCATSIAYGPGVSTDR